jgi:hypothetical protein
LLISELIGLPAEIPLILLTPDSDGSATFFAFSYENARLDSKISFFSCYLFTLAIPSNFFITSPSKSVAPSGGFSFSTFFFFSFSFFPYFSPFISLELSLPVTFEFKLASALGTAFPGTSFFGSTLELELEFIADLESFIALEELTLIEELWLDGFYAGNGPLTLLFPLVC